MTFHDVFYNYVLPTLLTGLGGIIAMLSKILIQYIKSKFKQLNHFKGDSVVMDSIIQAINELSSDMIEILKDGKITDKEYNDFRERIADITEAKLKNLYGFYKSDLRNWIYERIDVALPKFISPKLKDFVSRNL